MQSVDSSQLRDVCTYKFTYTVNKKHSKHGFWKFPLLLRFYLNIHHCYLHVYNIEQFQHWLWSLLDGKLLWNVKTKITTLNYKVIIEMH